MKFQSPDQLIKIVSNNNNAHQIWIPKVYLTWSELIEEIEEELDGLPFEAMDCPYPISSIEKFFNIVECLAFLKPLPKLDIIEDVVWIGKFFRMKISFWKKLMESFSDKKDKSTINSVIKELKTEGRS